MNNGDHIFVRSRSFFDHIGAIFDHLVKVLVAVGALCYHRIIKGRSTSE